MQSEVMMALKRHLASAAHVDVSQYQFINMEAVREAAGELWPAIRERVFIASRSIIEKRIAETDFVIPCATGFLVVFADAAGGEAEGVTEAIRQDMTAFFLGEEMLNLLQVEARAERLSVEEFTRTLQAAQARGSDIAFAEEAETAGPTPAPKPPGPAIEELVYAPAWDPRREAVAAFFATPRAARVGGAGWREGAALLREAEKPEARLALELDVLGRVQSDYEAFRRKGGRCGLIVTVTYPVLAAAKTRVPYVGALSNLSDAMRRVLLLRVEDAPTDAPASALTEAFRTVLPFCAQLLVHAPLGALSLARLEGAGASLIGFSLPGRRPDQAAADVGRISAMARRLKAGLYIDGVDAPEGLRAAAATEARLLSGPAVAGAHRGLVAPYRLPRAGVLSRAA